MKTWMFVVVAVVVAAAGCAGPQVSQRPGETVLIERTPDKKPGWVDSAQTAQEEKEKFLFIGAVKDKSDFALAIREAGIEATKIAADQLSRDLNTSLRSSIVGQNVGDDLGRAIQDIFVQEARDLKIMGLVQRERYVERWAEGTVAGQKTLYHAWALLEIPRGDYLASKQALLDRAAGRARESRNAKAEKVLDDFRAEIKAEKATP